LRGKITAIVTTYNKEKMFHVFLDSIRKQTRKPDEVVAVDDCSTDRMSDILREKCKDWKVVLLSQNKGQSHARNVGLRYATGTYVVFIDADLEMNPRMLEVMEKTLDASPDVSIAYGHYDRCGKRTDNVRAQPWDPHKLLQINYISMISMVKREHLPSPAFDEYLRRYEDWDLWLRMLKAGRKGKLVGNQVLFTAFYKEGDLSAAGESKMWYQVVKEKHGL
jgi:glycosyltransferase involved in cell wall biosynthesis